jgi:hypothetical protein
MKRFLIHFLNGALLVVLLIGVPAATRARFGHWEVGDAPAGQMATLWGLGLAVLINLLCATLFIKERKAQELCAKWTFIFAGLWLLEFAIFRSWIHFTWLKSFLQWLQKHF